jgi:hypothetical protein
MLSVRHGLPLAPTLTINHQPSFAICLSAPQYVILIQIFVALKVRPAAVLKSRISMAGRETLSRKVFVA